MAFDHFLASAGSAIKQGIGLSWHGHLFMLHFRKYKLPIATTSHLFYKPMMLLPFPYIRIEKDLGKILCRARRIKRKTQASVAKSVGIRRETLSKIEQGRTPQPQILDQLLIVLELDWCDVAVKGRGNKFRLDLDGERERQLLTTGERIQEQRAKERKSLTALSKQLGLSASTLSRLERGQLPRSRVFKDSPGFEFLEFCERPFTIVHSKLAAYLGC